VSVAGATATVRRHPADGKRHQPAACETVPIASTQRASVFDPAIAAPPPTSSQTPAHSLVGTSPQRSGGSEVGMIGA
jgi:hypothetical protein